MCNENKLSAISPLQHMIIRSECNGNVWIVVCKALSPSSSPLFLLCRTLPISSHFVPFAFFLISTLRLPCRIPFFCFCHHFSMTGLNTFHLMLFHCFFWCMWRWWRRNKNSLRQPWEWVFAGRNEWLTKIRQWHAESTVHTKTTERCVQARTDESFHTVKMNCKLFGQHTYTDSRAQTHTQSATNLSYRDGRRKNGRAKETGQIE